ncbi:MAG TPA: hypothetical protein VF221_01115 [Chloroflexota bacterium]
MTIDRPLWTGSVKADALAALLDFQSEHDWLDYKRQCDLSTTRGVVELAKDVGAMMISGGYVLVGADDNGQPAGDVEHLELFDTATLHNKLAKYVPKPFEIRAATHHFQGQSYALVYVAPHPKGCCIFERDGVYPDGKSQTIVFRAGEVFARHGTRSERWNQTDIDSIMHQLSAAADRGRDQQAEALEFLLAAPKQLGGSGLWLGLAVVPEYLCTDGPMITPAAAQQFLRDWHRAQAPVEVFGGGTATYRQPGCVVITSQAAMAEPPYWWRLAFYDAGQAAGAYLLAQEAAAKTPGADHMWVGLPQIVRDGQTIPARRDEVEIRLLTLLDLLTEHAADVGAGGMALVMTMLLAPHREKWVRIALLDEVVDDSQEQEGWRLATARARQPREDAVGVPIVHRVRLTDMRDPGMRMRAAHHLAADLLALFGIEQPAILGAEGTLDPYGAATDRQQLVYQHADHLGLEVDPVSPMERRQHFEAAIRAAREQLRQR